MKTKKLYDLTREDLGKKVRYEFDGDSVTVGKLVSISHYEQTNAVYFNIDSVKHSSTDPEATLIFVDEE